MTRIAPLMTTRCSASPSKTSIVKLLRLQTLGVELVALPLDHEPWEMRTVYVRDPEGNLVEFYGPLPTVNNE